MLEGEADMAADTGADMDVVEVDIEDADMEAVDLVEVDLWAAADTNLYN